jgi:hypothetical protein
MNNILLSLKKLFFLIWSGLTEVWNFLKPALYNGPQKLDSVLSSVSPRRGGKEDG